ncbi:hypothetical protein DRF65_08955 [Chryseobacterium pennae]|uniref:DNA-directed RNA polymerase n=1 Tax=Chryseobacterium pennae TaxID=2258962 RepID=A0A3D9CB22_9FLAO|nr:hypothetical protein [Chryseobacterium pennae]REC62934.1 hypothetical protein DRF65_08955 [Chryseobacterium pennae]
MQQYKSKKLNRKINVTAFYHKDFKWKVVLPTIIYNYLQDKLQEQPPFKGFKEDIALYYLSLIISVPARKKDKIYKYGYVPLFAQALKDKNYRYKEYFKYFLDIGILEYKEYSTSAKKSKSFRYNFSNIKFEGTECVNFQVFEISDVNFNKKLLKEDLFNDCFSSCPQLCTWFDDGLHIDFDRLCYDMQPEFCYNKYNLNYNVFNPILSKVYNYWYSALMLKEQCFRVSRKSDSDNRLHTNLTNMPSIFRPYLTYHGENIQSLDIKNSQPYFMVLVLENLENSNVRGIINKVFNNNSDMGIMMQKLQQITSSKAFQEEFSPLKNAVLTGQFYEFLMPLFPDIKPFKVVSDSDGELIEYYQHRFYNSSKKLIELCEFKSKRDLMKRLTLQILYTPLTRPSKEYMIFKLHFPLLCECIETFKATTDEPDSVKLFPRLLQQVESDCVLDKISKELCEKYPQMPLWTIHDSFCTTQSWFPIMETAVKELFLSYSDGILPSFKCDAWCKDCECLKVA